MKEKKNKGARKVLLMAISVALVAAISVSSTLAYLTAKTGTKDNVFQASGNISGRILEPNYDEENATKFAPGREVPKDPIIDNETADSSIYVGAKLEFLINVTDLTDANYVAVDYNTFTHFVNIKNLASDSTWKLYTTTDGISSTDNARYYFYDKILNKDADGSAETVSGSVTDTTKDYTSALFTSVTPLAAITIVEDGTATSADLTSTADLSTLKFKAFNFKIKITGYGIKADNTVTSDIAKEQIIKGLGGK